MTTLLHATRGEENPGTAPLPATANVRAPAPPTVAVVALGDFVDVLDATMLVRQLGQLAPKPRCTWFTSAEGASALRHLPDVHEIVVIAGPDPETTLAAQLEARRFDTCLEPLAAPRGFVPRGVGRFERMRLACELGWTLPPCPILRLSAEERAAAARCLARLPRGPLVLVECAGRRGQPGLDMPRAEAVLHALAPLGVTVLFAASEAPPFFAELRARWPDVVWFAEGPRIGAEVLNQCALFVGCGGAFTAIARTDHVRPELPRIECCSDALESSAGIPHLEDLTLCRDDGRFTAALARAAARLAFADPVPCLVAPPPRDRSIPAEPVGSREVSAAARAAYRELAVRARGPLRRAPALLELGAAETGNPSRLLAPPLCPAGSLDAVVLLHLLHAVPAPVLVLAHAHEALCAGGALVCVVPNGDSYAREVLGGTWPWLAARRHFDAASLRRELEELGYRIEAIRSTLGDADPGTVLRAIQKAEPGLASQRVPMLFADLLKAGRGEELIVVARKRGLERP